MAEADFLIWKVRHSVWLKIHRTEYGQQTRKGVRVKMKRSEMKWDSNYNSEGLAQVLEIWRVN